VAVGSEVVVVEGVVEIVRKTTLVLIH
jgi:hypothetical protein